MTPADTPLLNAMTVDVEDYFQVSAFEDAIERDTWDGYDCRVEANTGTLLDLFAKYDVSATFFVLGWVADRYPGLVARIHAAGHEIASHGYEHRLVYEMTPDAFRADLLRAKRALEAAAPVEVQGFRAPSFSIGAQNLWAHDVLREEGYRYSSSVFPVRHDRYGMPHFSRSPVLLEDALGRQLWEFPMTTWRVLGRNIPAAGGGWLRVLPLGVMHRAIRAANAKGTPAIVYTHPWEIDPGQPHVPGISRRARLRHRVNLGGTHGRLERLLRAHRFGTVAEVLCQRERALASSLPGPTEVSP